MMPSEQERTEDRMEPSNFQLSSEYPWRPYTGPDPQKPNPL